MPVPTFIHAPDDNLPDLFERNDPGAPKRMFDVIDQLGWIIDENPGDYLIAHNAPLYDNPMYIRVEGSGPIFDSFNPDNTSAAIVRSFTSLADAQNEQNAFANQQPVRSSSRTGSGNASTKINYGWIGNSRMMYLIVSGTDSTESSVSSGYQNEKFGIYAWGEIARLAGDPGVSIFGGGTNSLGTRAVNFASGDGGIRDGALTNSLASGPGQTAGESRSFSAASVRLGAAGGENNATSPFLSPVYIAEQGGKIRGSMPGLSIPSLGMGTLQEGIQENQAFTTLVGSASGLMVPADGSISDNEQTAYPVFFDLSNDWDLYHAA